MIRKVGRERIGQRMAVMEVADALDYNATVLDGDRPGGDWFEDLDLLTWAKAGDDVARYLQGEGAETLLVSVREAHRRLVDMQRGGPNPGPAELEALAEELRRIVC